MAVSQICDKFTIISKQKGKDTVFQAHIDLRQFDKDDSYNKGKERMREFRNNDVKGQERKQNAV